jgi:hypothetical protein
MKILFNSNITEIRVFEKAIHHSCLTYDTAKVRIGTKWLVFPVFETKEGFFEDDIFGTAYWGSVEDYNTEERKTFFEAGKFYYKPHCEIHMNNGKFHEVYFDTVDELTEYVKDLQRNAPHTIID